MERDEFVARLRAVLGAVPAGVRHEALLELAAGFLAQLSPAQLACVRREIAEQHAPRGDGAAQLLDLVDGHAALRNLRET